MGKIKKSTYKRKMRPVAYNNKTCIKTEDGTEFHVDRDVMIRGSDYFKMLFSYESDQNILIHEVTGEGMKLIIRYIENKRVILNTTNIVIALQAADFFMIKDFLQEIRSILPTLICEMNCIQIYSASVVLNHLDIFQLIYLYLKINFESVATNTDIEDLLFKDFQTLLSDSSLNIRNEEFVWNAIVNWVGKDKGTKYESVPLLLCCIRFEVCDESLLQKMIDHPILKENKFCAVLYSQNECKPNKNVNLQKHFIDSLQKLSSEPLICGPRQSQCRPIQCNVTYDQNKYKFGGITISALPYKDSRKSVLISRKQNFIPNFAMSYGSKVFIFGLNGQHFSVDLLKRSWVKLSPPPGKFDQTSFSAVHGRIFATSIKCDSSVNVSISLFDPQTGEWYKCSSSCLSKRRVEVSCFESAAIGGLIYIAARVCNSDSSKFSQCKKTFSLSSVYNTEINVWSAFNYPLLLTMYPMPFFRMISYHECLYFKWTIGDGWKRFHPIDRKKSTKELKFFDLQKALAEMKFLYKSLKEQIDGLCPSSEYLQEKMEKFKADGNEIENRIQLLKNKTLKFMDEQENTKVHQSAIPEALWSSGKSCNNAAMLYNLYPCYRSPAITVKYDIEDSDVCWKYHDDIHKQEWDFALKDWKQKE